MKTIFHGLGFHFRFVAKLNHNFYKVMLFLKTKVWCVGLSSESVLIYKNNTDKLDHKLLHRY